MTDHAGLYLHIPFCEKKCRYCDFYSSFVTDELLSRYTEALIKAVKEWGGKLNRPIDTVYFGGGTPSLLSKRLIDVMKAVRESFSISDSPEITLEINPSGNAEDILQSAKESGINRLSVGMQSGIDEELKILGRTHTARDTENTVYTARKMGFSDISLDLMSALPFSSRDSLKVSLDFLKRLSPSHISAYMLKIEKNTAFFRDKEKLSLPDDDATAEQYLFICEYLENAGYSHYEISNFCKDNRFSRHNIKYWRGDEYLGIGPSAHSFVGGKRFYYPRDLKSFISGNEVIFDGFGGTKEEYIMLRLRLKSGISNNEYTSLFGSALPERFISKCEQLEKIGLAETKDNRIALTNSGMLVSNAIITELLDCIE